MAGKFILSEELKWHTERPDGFVVAVFEWYNGIETETTYGIYDPREKEWTDGNCGVMVTPDRWVDINTYIETTRAELAAAQAEVERLRGIVTPGMNLCRVCQKETDIQLVGYIFRCSECDKETLKYNKPLKDCFQQGGAQ